MYTITGGGAFTRTNIDQINSNFLELLTGATTGSAIYCQPSATGVQNQNGSQSRPYTAFADAYSAARSGYNDVIYVVGDGSTTGSVRVTSTLTFSKNAVHVIGIGAPSYNPRVRFATLSGTTAFAQFVTVTGTGCIFSNFALFNDNAIASQITWTDQGGRNYYNGIQFGGMADATSAADAGSRILKLGGSGASGENLFDNCTFGVDTIARSAANATIEFAGSSKRNVFRNCVFPSRCTASTPIHLKSSGSNPLETFQLFVNPVFWNMPANGSGTALAAVATLAASGNGNVVLQNPSRFNITDWGTDATSNAQIYVDGAATGATDDIGRGAVAIAS